MIILIWIISLIILIASVVFVYRMLITSNEYISTDKTSPFKFLRIGTGRDKFYRQSLSTLNSKIKSLEDSNAYYEIQFSKLQIRVNGSLSESIPQKSFAAVSNAEEEDWEELYYQENESKVQLENNLDEALQNLEAANQEMLVLKEEAGEVAAIKSTADARMIQLRSLQNEIEKLHKELNGAVEREKELETRLNKEIALKTVYDKIENDNVRLRSETEDQKRQLTEMYQKEKESARQFARMKEGQIHLGIHEEEKKRKLVELKSKMENKKIFSE